MSRKKIGLLLMLVVLVGVGVWLWFGQSKAKTPTKTDTVEPPIDGPGPSNTNAGTPTFAPTETNPQPTDTQQGTLPPVGTETMATQTEVVEVNTYNPPRLTNVVAMFSPSTDADMLNLRLKSFSANGRYTIDNQAQPNGSTWLYAISSNGGYVSSLDGLELTVGWPYTMLAWETEPGLPDIAKRNGYRRRAQQTFVVHPDNSNNAN
jgi:hypothetical protein